MKTIVYIDGFNLYYGALKNTPHKWLNIEDYFQKLLPADNVVQIKYFTAEVSGPARSRQQTYLLALTTLPTVTTVFGKYKNKEVNCRSSLCTSTSVRTFLMPEEKRTDVNIAVHLIDDAYQNSADKFVVVSGDSDLVPAIQMARLRFPQIRIVVYVPASNPIRGAAVELRNAAHKHRTLPNNLLPRCQFPANLELASGQVVQKPPGW